MTITERNYALTILREACALHDDHVRDAEEYNNSCDRYPCPRPKQISHEEFELAAAVATTIDILEGRGAEVMPDSDRVVAS